ncbi:hypothetical protein AWU65_18500 [Paenibacillus glucanolyticus]|uniref:Uncharacterized protein n=1 Tax=Paenibacillus glucanolyticus TaxID=59843 RepID=A0A162EMK8_9BACL|nr:hypothetical protein [Paenibacillus glucanolyticus]KZS47771.1 hypothetical protein AWU65_18500 [Paenibacillus glucanolyticus]
MPMHGMRFLTAQCTAECSPLGKKLLITPILNEQIKYYNAALSRDTQYTDKFKEVILTKGSLPSVYLFPQSKYQTLVLDVRAIQEDVTIILKNKDNREELKSLFIPQDKPEQIEINIAGIKELEVEVRGNAVIYPTSHYK